MNNKNKVKNNKNKVKKAIIICSIIIIILFLLIIGLIIFGKKDEQDKPKEQEQVQNESKIDYIRNKGEKERIQIYLAEYIRNIERKEYRQAYEKLYPQFKQNYFPTIKTYISYLEENYSELMMITYEDFQRQGNYYILSTIITNLDEIETEKTQKFIIYENDLNDYYISFQAK